MGRSLAGLIPWLERTFAPPGAGVDARRRAVILASCALISVPVITLYALEDLVAGRWLEAAIILGVAAVLVVDMVLLPRVRDFLLVTRLTAVPVLALLGYEAAMGAGEGFALLWFYIFPTVVFFLFGRREGLVWTLAVLAVAAAFLLLPLGAHRYPIGLTSRFLVTYAIVGLLAYGLESSRQWHHERLLAEKARLEEALAQIRRLSGLLPICASCKKVRDDRGYWTQIEAYVRERSEADFTHGICPECAARLYPEVACAQPPR